MNDDIAELRKLIDINVARKQRFEALTRASELMRQAAEILLTIPSSPETVAAAEKVSEAWSFLTPPGADEEEGD